jgi:phospholipid/cholesterol/gamma-HCH transport system substrate-binding protein
VIRAAGQQVGEVHSISAIDGGRAVKLGLDIDNSAWPLPRGTTMTLRWGGTISYDDRYIALVRGPAGGPPMGTNGVFPARSFSVPGELDQLLATFTRPVRHDVQTFLDEGGVTLHTASPDLRRALEAAPAALNQTSPVLQDVDSSEKALDTLLRSTDEVVNAAQSANPGVAKLITGAATTFGAVASKAQQVRQSLAKAPATFTHARDTLAHANGTLTAAANVTDRLAPGVDQVRKIAAPLNSALHTVVKVGPDATATLATARKAAPDLNPLLDRVTNLMPEIGSIGGQATTELNCIRPYTPDIVGFTTDWGDFISATDGKDHYFRAQVQSLVPAPENANTENSGQMAKTFPWIKYAFPSPPGWASGTPWFQPQCGEGPETIDPQKDPEAKTYSPIDQIPPLFSKASK